MAPACVLWSPPRSTASRSASDPACVVVAVSVVAVSVALAVAMTFAPNSVAVVTESLLLTLERVGVSVVVVVRVAEFSAAIHEVIEVAASSAMVVSDGLWDVAVVVVVAAVEGMGGCWDAETFSADVVEDLAKHVHQGSSWLWLTG